MTIVSQPLTNSAYGFPTRGAQRRITPVALACVHITGNERTAAYTDLHAAAEGERNYANRAGSNGPSAHLYVARDGWAIRAIGSQYAAWSNGDVSSPNTDNPGIRRVLALRAKGYNANEAYWEEIENLGSGSKYPINAAQKQLNAEVIAARSKASGLPINRETVHGHWEINGVDRQNCPNSIAQGHEAFLNDIIARAKALSQESEMGTLITLVDPVAGKLDIPAGTDSILVASPLTYPDNHYKTPTDATGRDATLGARLTVGSQELGYLVTLQGQLAYVRVSAPGVTFTPTETDLDAAIRTRDVTINEQATIIANLKMDAAEADALKAALQTFLL